MPALVSVIMPVYNSEPWLAEAVNSVLSQTWPRVELIMVDDGSTDQSLSIARRFEGQGVKVITQKNAGPSAARARALAEAQGDYLQYLDADDLLSATKIEQQIQVLESENSGYVAACPWGRFANDPTRSVFTNEPVWNDLDPVTWLVTSHEGGGMMPPNAWLTPRHIAERAGGWDVRSSLNDDGEYFARILLASKGVRFVPEARVFYRSVNQSWSSSRTPQSLASLYNSVESISSHLLAAENSSRTRHALATAYQRFIYTVYPAQPKLIAAAEARVRELGGTDFKMHGGPTFNRLRDIVGWRYARRMQLYTYRVRARYTLALKRLRTP